MLKMTQLVTTWTVITLSVLADLTFGARSLVNHGGSYVFRSASEELYLTARRPLYRNLGLHPGNVTVEPFDGTQVWAQAFDVLYVGNKTAAPTKLPESDQLQLIWLIANQASLNSISLTINPYSVIPLKNFVVLVPIPEQDANNEETKQFQIRSVDLDQCVQSQGKSQAIVYARCDFTNKDQRFLAEFLYGEPLDTSDFPEAIGTFESAMDYYF